MPSGYEDRVEHRAHCRPLVAVEPKTALCAPNPASPPGARCICISLTGNRRVWPEWILALSAQAEIIRKTRALSAGLAPVAQVVVDGCIGT